MFPNSVTFDSTLSNDPVELSWFHFSILPDHIVVVRSRCHDNIRVFIWAV